MSQKFKMLKNMDFFQYTDFFSLYSVFMTQNFLIKTSFISYFYTPTFLQPFTQAFTLKHLDAERKAC